jgi:hypothetical protein
LQTRQRTVLIPIRGNGKCPTVTSYNRFEDQTCNENSCVGDEVCVANQDLIVLLDGSGSLKESGFAILRQFAANLTTRYVPSTVEPEKSIAMGVVLFGNGYVKSDGTIARALKVQSLTTNMADTKAKIEALTWQKGFTNLAQGFAAADTMLDQDGREGSQSAVLVIWDGKINFEFETKSQAQRMKEKNVWMFMEPIMETNGAEELHFMTHELASQPWQTNFYRIPGLEALKSNNELYVAESIAMFCPKAISPSMTAATTETDCDGVETSNCPDVQGWDETIDITGLTTKTITLLCVSQHASTGGSSCTTWCSSRTDSSGNNYECIRAQDNAGGCNLDSRHSRQSTANNGCDQNWGDQICQCGMTTR